MKRWYILYFVCSLLLCITAAPSVHAEEEPQPPPVSRSESWTSPEWTGNRHEIFLYVDEERVKRTDTLYHASPFSATFDLRFDEAIKAPNSAKAQRITYGVYKGELTDAELVAKHTLTVEDTGTEFIDSFTQDFLFEDEGPHFIFVYRHCEDFFYEGYCADHPTDQQIEKWITEGFDGNDGTPEWPPKEWGYIPFHVWFYKLPSWVNPTWTGEDLSLTINGQTVSEGDTVELLEGSNLNVEIVHPGKSTDYTRLLVKGELNQGGAILCNSSEAGGDLADLETISTEINLEVGSECEHSDIAYNAESGEYFITAMQARPCKVGDNCHDATNDGGERVTAPDMIEWIQNGDDEDPETFEFPPKYWGTISFSLEFVSELSEEEQPEGDNEEEEEETATSTPSGNSNIVFLHGIKASRLYVKENGQFVKVWEPNWNNDVKKLYLDESGESINEVYVGEPIDEARIDGLPFKRSIYNDFFDFLDELKADGSVNDWHAISYDWRKDLQDVVTQPIRHINGTNKTMVEIIEEMASSSENGKVTIIGHSNGGLVGKLLISKLVEQGKGDLVDDFITIGTPHLGTSQTISSILHGYGQNIPIILKRSIGQKFAVNAPGAYTLLPTERYFFRVDDPVVVVEEGVETQYLFDAYGESIESREELTSFLKGEEGREEPVSTALYKPYLANSTLLNEAQTLQETLDNWHAPTSINTINFVGWGRDTIKGIRYYTRIPKLCINIFGTCTKFDYAPLFTRDGDNTVVAASARGDGIKFYLDLLLYDEDKLGTYKHESLANFPPLHQFLRELLTSQVTIPSPYITDTKPNNRNRKGILMLSLHSPVTLTVIDHSGHEVGVVETDSTDIQIIREDIPGASYFEFGEGKYVTVDVNDIASVKMEGYEEGYFTVEISEAYGNAHYSFSDLETTTSTIATLAIGDSIENSILSVDYEGDGMNDDILALTEKAEGGGGGTFASAPDPKVAGEITYSNELTKNVSQLLLDSQFLIDSLPSLQDLDLGQKYELNLLLEEMERVLDEYVRMNLI